MDFGIIYQLKIKKFWWLDVILYFVSALLLATLFCFLVFSFKISLEKKRIAQLDEKIASIGTTEQKEREKKVFEYKMKIEKFSDLLAKHKMPTRIFKIFEEITLPNVWFNSFSLNAFSPELRVAGQTDDMLSLSRQLAIFEEQEFVKNITNLNFGLTEDNKTEFNFVLTFDPNILFFSAENLKNEESNTMEPSTP